MRNDGTDEAPVWVCNNPSCVCYVPPAPEPTPEPEGNGEEDSEEAE
jgi:hypothetical protein